MDATAQGIEGELHRLRIVPYDSRYDDRILALASALHGESRYRVLPFDPERTLAHVRAFAADESRYLIRLAVRGPELEGGFLGGLTSMYFSAAPVGRDMGWFVRRDRRGSWAAYRLVQAFEAWGRERGIKLLILGQSTGVDVEAVSTLYRRLGYVKVGENAMKEV